MKCAHCGNEAKGTKEHISFCFLCSGDGGIRTRGSGCPDQRISSQPGYYHFDMSSIFYSVYPYKWNGNGNLLIFTFKTTRTCSFKGDMLQSKYLCELRSIKICREENIKLLFINL